MDYYKQYTHKQENPYEIYAKNFITKKAIISHIDHSERKAYNNRKCGRY